MRRPRRVVVVGNGIAGLTAADTLRAEGYDGELVLVGDEPHPAYSRPALSKALLRDESDLTSHQLPPATHGATELLGVRAVGLDVERREVLLERDRLGYDALVITTGCRPRRLGPEGSGELTLRTLDDALALRARIVERPSVVVIGGGPLGMEIASGCLEAGCEVTLLSQGQPLEVQLGRYLSGVILGAAVEQGLRLVLTDGASVEAPGRVRLAEGTVLGADLVVTAAGDVPNTEWLAGTGLLRNGLLAVDKRGRLAPAVVAAGDVAAFPTARGLRRLPLWTSAIEQSKVAAAAVLHGEGGSSFVHRPYFWTEQFRISLKAIGDLPFDEEPVVVDGDVAERSALLQWGGAAAALNYRVPIPRLRRLSEVVPAQA
jgi:NADPH-dependent 2,4-dienoyl-CoA reductase/sulfur reductase-like enzyme